ncbi:MAG TPA: hypothetical protein VK358_18780, partial [Longimicrobium sp.]|nr:hypothetical protein [Longimicrobium sp.]
MPETMEGIRVPIVVNDRGALREVKRGMGFVVADLKKRIKSMDNAGLPTHDLDEALAVWLGNGGDAGVIHQVEEQLDGVVPAAAPAGGDTVDMFDEVPVATGPNPPAERVLVTADELRDRLASGCQVYVPAAVIGRWPREMRAAVQDYEADVRTALEVGGVLPEVPAWLIDYPLPALVHRVGDALFHRSDADAEPERIHDPVEWLEEVAEAEITLREDAALRAAHPGQPWVPVDVGYGEGLERWQVMHRETRERRRVDAGFFAGQAEGDAVDGPEHAASAGPEECVAAYAFHLSTTEPGGPVAEADVAGNVEAGARLLRALLFDSGLVVSLSAILDEWDADQRQAAWEWATSSDGSSTPEHVRLAHWSHDEFTALHPDEDFAAELAAAG